MGFFKVNRETGPAKSPLAGIVALDPPAAVAFRSFPQRTPLSPAPVRIATTDPLIRCKRVPSRRPFHVHVHMHGIVPLGPVHGHKQGCDLLFGSDNIDSSIPSALRCRFQLNLSAICGQISRQQLRWLGNSASFATKLSITIQYGRRAGPCRHRTSGHLCRRASHSRSARPTSMSDGPLRLVFLEDFDRLVDHR